MGALAVTERDRRNYPTYMTAQRVLSGDLTAPAEFLGWTILRAVIILPGFALVGVRGGKLIWGSLASSTLISLFALYRSYATGKEDRFGDVRRLPPRRRRR